jgi:hypothetical protein
LKKKSHGFLQEYATNSDSANVSAAIFKDNCNFNLISMFVVELPNPKCGDMIGRKGIM